VLPSWPSCPPGLRPLLFRSDRGRGSGLSSPSLDGGLDEVRGVCPQPRLKLSDPLPGLRQLLHRPGQRSLRLAQLRAQRRHQGAQHLICGASVISGHTRTLLPPRDRLPGDPASSRSQQCTERDAAPEWAWPITRGTPCYCAAVPVWACLLRAVNLGKQRKLPMPALRGPLTAAGMTDVGTYPQSGNVIAHSQLQARQQASDLVRAVIAAEFSLDIPVITRRPAEIDDVIASNPFSVQAAQRAHLIRVIFLAAVPPPDRIDQLMSDSSPRETCRVAGRHVYVDYVRGYHNTGRTASYFPRALGVDGAERNWRTVPALSALVRERAPGQTLGNTT
jgi:uncharacterized protein (DUF1697 family)